MKYTSLFNIALISCLFVCPFSLFGQTDKYEYPKDSLVFQKVKEWQDQKFGLFMHWGTYSEWGVIESWSLCPEDWSWNPRPKDKSYAQYVKEYENLITTFNPTKFDPDKWALAAKEAGMRYVVFTTKHHDGFNMFDTRQSDYKITGQACPFSANSKADVTKEVFEAFRREDFMIGAYFSTSDWHNNDFWWDYFPPKDRTMNYSPKKYPEKWCRYNQFVYNQLEELSTGYGKLDLFWFDLNHISKEKKVDWQPISSMLRRNQPGVMMVVRSSKGEYENYRTPEQEVPEKALDYPWETCMTMGDSWSYKPNDNYKSAYQLVQLLVRIVSRGGNLLLNIGPGPDGDFDPVAYQRLNEIGQWMKINGKGIYSTKSITPYEETKMVFTRKDDSVYAFYLPDEDEKEMPANILISSFQPVEGSQVYLLGYEKPLSWMNNGKGMVISIPKTLQHNPICQYAWAFQVKAKSLIY
ncbi:alpha-L-fucosidase [Geofilum sp. OHC36d9]|uniref:alpha-L-fucosidase n=1 Tax=Geofilum sp. OHC36d9 TaxID=3458413 RepID=UPI004033DC08